MFSWLAVNALAAAGLALLALGAERLLRRRPAVVHLLWLAVLVRLVLPPLPDLGSLWSPRAASTAPYVPSAPGLLNRAVVRLTEALGTNWSTQGLFLALALFLACGVFLVGREVRRIAGLRRRLARAGEPAPEVAGTAERLGLPAPPTLRTDAVETPCVFGLLRPVLLLPRRGAGTSPAVIAHELAHIHRRDHLAGWLDLVAMGLHFWNPLYWLARRRMYLAAEWACDAWALERFPSDRTPYARSLVDAVERSLQGVPCPRAQHAVGVGVAELEHRLDRILTGEDAGRRPRWAAWAVGLLLVVSLPGLGAPTLESFRAALPGLPSGVDEGYFERRLEAGRELLAADPDDGRGHALLGIGLVGLGRMDEAREAFERQIELGHRTATGRYNLACVHTLAGRPDEALGCLEAAAAEGFPVLETLRDDPDLVPLRRHPGLERVRAIQASALPASRP